MSMALDVDHSDEEVVEDDDPHELDDEIDLPTDQVSGSDRDSGSIAIMVTVIYTHTSCIFDVTDL